MSLTPKAKKVKNDSGRLVDFRDADGKKVWVTSISYYQSDGKKKSTKTTYHGTKADAIKDAHAKRMQLEGHSADLDESMTVEQLLQAYLDGKEVQGLKYSTMRNYEGNIKHQIVPYLRGKKAAQVTIRNVDTLYKKLLSEGKVNGGPLSARTVHRVHVILGAAYRYAIAKEWLTKNPTVNADVPSITPKEVIPFTNEEIQQLLPLIEESHHLLLKPAFMLALYTGARLNELFALTYKDLFLAETAKQAPYIMISKSVTRTSKGSGERVVASSPKTATSGRKVTIDRDLVDFLVLHKEEQRQFLAQVGIMQTDNTPVLAGSLGEMMHGDIASKALKRLLKHEGFRSELTFHSLRHTHCSQLLSGGAPIATVSKRLGHASSDITLRVYNHSMPGEDQKAAEQIGDIMRAIRNSTDSSTEALTTDVD